VDLRGDWHHCFQLAHRKSKGYEAAQFTHSTRAEIVWTIIPVVILVVMAVPATTALVHMEVAPETDMTVKITGFQWRWKYEYMEDDIRFISSLHSDSNAARRLASGTNPESVENYLLEVDNPLVLPANTKIKFLITADDVIHSWWVPSLGWKRDAVPGFINEAWTEIMEPGVYRGQCAELCGKDHGFMPIVLNVLPRDEYQAWAEDQRRDCVCITVRDLPPGGWPGPGPGISCPRWQQGEPGSAGRKHQCRPPRPGRHRNAGLGRHVV
jgi:cytochrome c oxidase subunit 2